MRISDWSSDVCSSDLKIGLAAVPAGTVHAGDQPHGRGIDMEALCVQYERVADMRVEDFGDDDELTRPGLHAVKRPAFKTRRHRCYTRRFDHPAWRQDEIGTDCFVNLRRSIGRASIRARVCQYV